MGGREGSEDVGDRCAVIEAAHLDGRVVGLDLSDVELHPPPLLAFHRTEMVGELVASDPAQPGEDVGAAVEPGALVDRGNEGLLAELLGQTDIIATPRQDVGVDARERPPVPGLEGVIARERQLELVRRRRGSGASGRLPRVRSFEPA
jgi:hypothetical protein